MVWQVVPVQKPLLSDQVRSFLPESLQKSPQVSDDVFNVDGHASGDVSVYCTPCPDRQRRPAPSVWCSWGCLGCKRALFTLFKLLQRLMFSLQHVHDGDLPQDASPLLLHLFNAVP